MSLLFGLTAGDLLGMLSGALNTALFSMIAAVFGLAIGIACATMRLSKVWLLRLIAGAYVEFTRNTPLLVQVFIFFFALPSIGFRLTADQAAVLALVFNFGAYSAEIVRAGIVSIHRGQIEAAQSLGLQSFEIFRHVVILPALEKVYPPLVSQFTLLMLSSSIISAIGANELTSVANSIQSRTFQSFPVYVLATLLYLGLTLLFRAGFLVLARYFFPRRRVVGAATTQVR